MNGSHFQRRILFKVVSFCGIVSHDMPTIGDDNLERSLTGDTVFSLKTPHTKRPPSRSRKKRIKSQF